MRRNANEEKDIHAKGSAIQKADMFYQDEKGGNAAKCLYVVEVVIVKVCRIHESILSHFFLFENSERLRKF